MTGREQQSEKRTGGAPVQRLQRGESGRAGLSLADRRKVSCSHVCTTGKLGRPLDGESKAIGGRHETQGTAAGSRLFRARPTGRGPLSSHTRDFRLASGGERPGVRGVFLLACACIWRPLFPRVWLVRFTCSTLAARRSPPQSSDAGASSAHWPWPDAEGRRVWTARAASFEARLPGPLLPWSRQSVVRSPAGEPVPGVPRSLPGARRRERGADRRSCRASRVG